MKHILVIRLSALGDICMTLPVLDSVCRSHPQVRFTLLTSRAGAAVAQAVLSDLPNLNVMGINAKRDYAGLKGLNRLYVELRQLGIDGVADLHDVLRTKWLRLRFRLGGLAVATIDKGRSQKKALVAHAICRQLKHGTERYKEVFDRLGFPTAMTYDAAAHGQRLRPSIGNEVLSAESNTKSESRLGIAPFAQHRGKIYPTQQMRQVIDLLMERCPNLHIYLFGSPDERAELDTWVAAYPTRLTNLAGTQTLADDLRVMAQLDLIVSMDSANMHLASLVGLRCVSIWGATHPWAGFLGHGQQADDVLSLPLSCRPCSIYGNKPCKYGDWHCLTNLKAELVAQAIVSRL